MNMKSFFAASAAALVLYSCSKSNNNNNNCTTDFGNPTSAEVTTLRNYITTNSISATEDTRGFFYNITFPGTGSESPALTDSVTVRYRGSLTDGTVFDSTKAGQTVKFPLNKLITGWQVGLPLIKKNGIIDLYLPPSFGYGCYGQYPIPGNAITIFHVELVDF